MKDLKEFLESTDLNIDWSCIDFEDVESMDDLWYILDCNQLLDVEIIYYYNAIEYLSENDASLNESLQLAYECGYEPQNLNSEILASLHASHKLRDDFDELRSEIETFIGESASLTN